MAAVAPHARMSDSIVTGAAFDRHDSEPAVCGHTPAKQIKRRFPSSKVRTIMCP